MPYEYRKLSQIDRQEVLRKRKMLGYPLHAPPHPYRWEGYYLLSAANYEHASIMEAPERRTEFENLLLTAFKECKAEVIGWVILPNHYHILVDVETLDLVSTVLKQVHGGTGRRWNSDDGLTHQRRVWYKFSDRLIRNEAHFYKTLNYIHYNPVKHGYTSDAYQWPWSSLHIFYEEYGRDWLREKWKAYPPTDFGKGWAE
jgi:putative transposase